ncbi:DUF2834 domain-containing protein [Marinomonas transparens]|uniref:DUF2834 domain-containing protein n=1 Tax=Marinomonas transparens TaxID=2795388 RepID=A0A934JKF3_9GAMM|nr:DUF2834 domain-containing protein [Marinomonas transparens]MBJ7537451.1 DUF2834 domain-containing protein [Marinomonas transparens]
MKVFYLLLTILGVVLPYGAFLPWLFEKGVDLPAFLNAAIANPISVFAWLDVLVSAVTLLAFILVDGRRNGVKYYGLAMVGTLTVGVSCGLPLYLFLREKLVVKE